MKEDSMKTYNVSYRWKILLVLLAFLLTVTSIVSISLYVNIYNVMMRQNIESNHNVLIQLKNAADILMEQIEGSLIQIANDTSILSYMDTYEQMDYYQRGIIFERVTNVLSSNSYFDSLFVYYFDQNTILDGDSMESISKPDSTSRASVMKQALELYHSGNRIKIIKNDEPASKSNSLLIVKPLPMLSSHPKVLLVLTVDGSYFDDVMKSIKINEKAGFFIFDTENNLLSGNKQLAVMMNDEGSFVDIIRIDPQAFGKPVKLNGQDMLVDNIVSGSNGWKYTYALPFSEIEHQVEFVKNYLLVISILCLFLGLGLALFMSKKLYMPIFRIYSILRQTETASLRGKDEVSYLNNGILRLMDRNSSLEALMEANLPVLKNNALTSLLKGELEEDNLADKLGFYHVQFCTDGYFTVCVFSMDNYVQIVRNYSAKQLSMLKIYQMDLIRMVLEKENITGETVEISLSEMAVILNPESSPLQELDQLLGNLVRKLHETINENMKFTTSIGIGRSYRSVADIGASYKEALQAVGYRMITGNNSIVFFHQLDIANEGSYSYPFDIEQGILKELRTGNRQGITDGLKKFAEAVGSRRTSQYRDFRFIFMQLLNSTIHCLHDMSIRIDSLVEGDIYENLMREETVEGLLGWLNSLYDRILCYIERKKYNHNDELIASVKDFIEQNYSMEDMTLEFLADRFHFSSPYLSTLFKDVTGHNIKEYITQIRLNKARELLSSTTMPVAKISEAVGYSNIRAFSKIFKKYIGMTPGGYRTIG